MKDINLLPKEHLLQLKLERTFVKLIAFWAIIFFFLILFVNGVSVLTAVYENKHMGLLNQYAHSKYQDANKLVENYNQAKNEKEQITSILTDIQATATNVASVTNHIFDAMPQGVRVYTLTVDNMKKMAIFLGVANTKEEVAIFVENLNRTSRFEQSLITTMSMTEDRTIRFSLEIMMNKEVYSP